MYKSTPQVQKYRAGRAARQSKMVGAARRAAYAGSRSLARRAALSKESGFVDFALSTFNCNTTGTIALVATVPQGTSVSQRVGKKILLKGMQLKGSIAANSATTVSDYAILLVYDKRPSGSLPAITDILNTANSNSFNNDANSGRFRVLRRWDGVLIGNSTTPATGKEAVDFSHYVGLRGMPSVFKAAGTGAIDDIEEGALYLISVGSTAAGTGALTASVGCRTRFVDC